MYGERMNQLDLRIAKLFRFGGTRTSASLDVFNLRMWHSRMLLSHVIQKPGGARRKTA
jgi:hypothetical protein